MGVFIPWIADDPQRLSPTPVLARPAGEYLGHRGMELFIRVIQGMARVVVDLTENRGSDDGLARAEVSPCADQEALGGGLYIARPSEKGCASLPGHPLVGDDQRNRRTRGPQRLEQLERGRSGRLG